MIELKKYLPAVSRLALLNAGLPAVSRLARWKAGFITILLVLFLPAGFCHAQDDVSPASAFADSLQNAMNNSNSSETEKSGPNGQDVYMSDTIHKHEFNKEEWKKVIKGLEYNETREKPKKPDPKPKRDEPVKYREPNTGGSFLEGSVAQTILIIAAAIALAFIVFKLMSGKVSNTKIARKQGSYSIEDIEDALHESDLERYLREAIEQREFRLAIRIYYLMALKELSVREWIAWKKDKTNNQYLFEMSSRPNFALFRDITRLFEYTWYGELTVDEKHFHLLDPKFREFLLQLKNIPA